MKNMEYKDKVVIVTGGAQAAMTIDTTNLCSHLQKKLFEPEGVYYPTPIRDKIAISCM